MLEGITPDRCIDTSTDERWKVEAWTLAIGKPGEPEFFYKEIMTGATCWWLLLRLEHLSAESTSTNGRNPHNPHT